MRLRGNAAAAFAFRARHVMNCRHETILYDLGDHRQDARTRRSQSGDVLYDLGSGDGRLVIRAAQKYGVRTVGIEMDRLLLDKARQDVKAAGVSRLVEFRAEDALQANISAATVVTLYMLPWFNEKMKFSFEKYLKPGARIIAHDFGIEGWEPDQTVKLPGYELKLVGTSTSTRCICGE